MPESRTIKLNNGIEMDRVGLGFWEVRGAEAEKTLAEVKHAMKIDYFDTPEFLEEQREKFK